MESNEIFRIKPKFNLIYELVMPVGKKLKRSLFIVIALIVIMIVLKLNKGKIDMSNIPGNIDFMSILFWICVFFTIIFAFKFIIDMALKIMQYNRMSYTFNQDNIIYEDNFLNQQKKVIKYENIKEVEIRRSILDRILGYGIIIISTNAEGNISSGLVIYGIKDSNDIYKKINDLVQTKSSHVNEKVNNQNVEQPKAEPNIEQPKVQIEDAPIPTEVRHDEDFTSSLKNINR